MSPADVSIELVAKNSCSGDEIVLGRRVVDQPYFARRNLHRPAQIGEHLRHDHFAERIEHEEYFLVGLDRIGRGVGLDDINFDRRSVSSFENLDVLARVLTKLRRELHADNLSETV